MENAIDYVNGLCASAKKAQKRLGASGTATRNNLLYGIAEALRGSIDTVLAANAEDIANAEQNGVPKAMIDRLRLSEARITAIADAVNDVAALPDPCGNGTVTVRPNGLKITKMSVPLGVIGMIYEARPNVTVDAAALCLKSGNAVVLKGGKEAICTNRALVKVMKEALGQELADCVAFIDSVDRAATNALMNAKGLIDVLIPRGGKGLIRAVVDGASVPVIETGAGNCHLYVDKAADLDKALSITVNAKCSRPSVCNAIETLLVHRDVAEAFLPRLYAATREHALEIRGDEATVSLVTGAIKATEEDYATEYNDYILAVKTVESLDAAVEHIGKYTTGHSEGIVTEDISAAQQFTSRIDAAAVYVNASTRFTDGGEFGFGAEIGISTQKLHARGPMGLAELTTVKYIVEGNGQVR